jgi:small subunit ribosomal protein S6
MRRYELMLLFRPDLEDDKLQSAVEKVTRAIVNAGGALTKVSPWGKRRMAYEIQHFREASYFLLHFDIAPSAIREIERGLLISEEILRHLVTVLELRGRGEGEEDVDVDVGEPAQLVGERIAEPAASRDEDVAEAQAGELEAAKLKRGEVEAADLAPGELESGGEVADAEVADAEVADADVGAASEETGESVEAVEAGTPSTRRADA